MKGQIRQVFIYIAAIIIFAIVAIYGYTAIRNLLGVGERVGFVQFKTKLEEEIRKIATQPGDVVVFNADNPLRLPRKYKKVCFIDLSESPDPEINETSPIIYSAWSKGIKQNVFLIPPGPAPIFIADARGNEIINIERDSWLCLDTKNGRIDFAIEGTGSSTIIRQIPQQ